MATLTKDKRRILANAKIRNDVSDLSSGNYYDSWSEWVHLLHEVVEKHGLRVHGDIERPHSDEGQHLVHLVHPGDLERTVGVIWYSWYRMKPSYRWEIINYVG